MTDLGVGLLDSAAPLIEGPDALFLDLDGVVYDGPDPIDGVVEAFAAIGAAGLPFAFLTNNASRTAEEVAAHLTSFGIGAVPASAVVTSAQAIASIMAAELPAGAAVLVVGGPGLREPVAESGLRIVESADDEPVAVVQGFHPEVGWRHLAEASYAVRAGARWYASNGDLTFPSGRGLAPGNGSLIQTVANATGQRPFIAGKPGTPLFDEARRRLGCARPLMVGDRLDTDVEGAIASGMPILGVLSGVEDLGSYAAAPVGNRPSFVAANLSGILLPQPPVELLGDKARCGTAEAVHDGVVRLTCGQPDSVEALRVLLTLAWAVTDRSGEIPQIDATMAP
jgi:HAD superfamily hydrolase (TIGR01450 family)